MEVPKTEIVSKIIIKKITSKVSASRPILMLMIVKGLISEILQAPRTMEILTGDITDHKTVNFSIVATQTPGRQEAK